MNSVQQIMSFGAAVTMFVFMLLIAVPLFFFNKIGIIDVDSYHRPAEMDVCVAARTAVTTHLGSEDWSFPLWAPSTEYERTPDEEDKVQEYTVTSEGVNHVLKKRVRWTVKLTYYHPHIDDREARYEWQNEMASKPDGAFNKYMRDPTNYTVEIIKIDNSLPYSYGLEGIEPRDRVR